LLLNFGAHMYAPPKLAGARVAKTGGHDKTKDQGERDFRGKPEKG
jgi:hypothetical protein